MAAIRQVNIVPAAVPDAPGSPRAEFARLASLHAEAEETAHLANLLGRAPYAAGALALVAGVAAALTAGSAETVTWLVLMVMGLGAMARAYGQAIAAPFERAALKSFAQDLTAITVYLGFAWGAGAFLMLPASSGFAVALLYAAGASGLFAGLLRERDIALGFIAPASALSAIACLLRPLSGGALGAALVLIGCGLVAGAVVLAARLASSGRGMPKLQLG